MPSPIFPFNTGVAVGTGAEGTIGSANANGIFGAANANNVIVQAGATAAGVAANYSSELGPYAIGANLAGVVTGVQQYSDYANDPDATTSELVGTGLQILGNLIAVAGGAAEFAGLEGPGFAFQVAGDLVATAGADLVISERPDTESTYIPNFTDTTSTPPLTDAQLAQVASQLAAMQPAATPMTPATTSPSAPTNTTTPPLSPDNTTPPASTNTGTVSNTGPIAPTQDGSVDPREILYALNQGDVALSAQTQIQYESSQGDTDLATQLQNALNQGNIGNTAQVQDSQLQGSELQNQLEQTNPGLDAQIQSGLGPDITNQATAVSPTDNTGAGAPPATTGGPGTDDTSGAGVPSPIPVVAPPASTPISPVGQAVTDPIIVQSGATISGDNSELYNVTGNNLSEAIAAGNVSPVFLNGNNDSLNLSAATASFAITDNGQGTAIDLTGIMPSADSSITINDFQNDSTGSIILPSQYATASAAVAALQSDGQGGSILPLSNGASLHFVNDPSLSASSFTVGHA